MKIIAFDPSSATVGYSVSENGAIIDAGLIKPTRTKDDAATRIRDMRRDVVDLVDEHYEHHWQPDTIAVIESPSKHVGRRHGGGGAGLAIYGWAVGMVQATCVSLMGEDQVHVVSVDEWTRGRRKASRLAMVKAAWPAWTVEADPGMDAADAIALNLFWIDKQLAAAPEGVK